MLSTRTRSRRGLLAKGRRDDGGGDGLARKALNLGDKSESCDERDQCERRRRPETHHTARGLGI